MNKFLTVLLDLVTFCLQDIYITSKLNKKWLYWLLHMMLNMKKICISTHPVWNTVFALFHFSLCYFLLLSYYLFIRLVNFFSLELGHIDLCWCFKTWNLWDTWGQFSPAVMQLFESLLWSLLHHLWPPTCPSTQFPGWNLGWWCR